MLSNLLCCPVLYPQMTGGAVFPGADTVNASVTQSPIDRPFTVEAAAPSTVVPAAGWAMLNVCGRNIFGLKFTFILKLFNLHSPPALHYPARKLTF